MGVLDRLLQIETVSGRSNAVDRVTPRHESCQGGIREPVLPRAGFDRPNERIGIGPPLKNELWQVVRKRVVHIYERTARPLLVTDQEDGVLRNIREWESSRCDTSDHWSVRIDFIPEGLER